MGNDVDTRTRLMRAICYGMADMGGRYDLYWRLDLGYRNSFPNKSRTSTISPSTNTFDSQTIPLGYGSWEE